MPELTIHDIDDSLMEQLRTRAAKEECSVEELICRILREVYAEGAVELELAKRSAPRDPRDFRKDVEKGLDDVKGDYCHESTSLTQR